jgi:hypothetical protein
MGQSCEVDIEHEIFIIAANPRQVLLGPAVTFFLSAWPKPQYLASSMLCVISDHAFVRKQHT